MENINEEKIPTKEELIAFMTEQIEVKTVQFQLQELSTKLAISKAEELKALSFIAQMSSPKSEGKAYEGGMPHIITQEDMDNNPDLADEGVKVGDEVMIPVDLPKPEKRSLKKK